MRSFNCEHIFGSPPLTSGCMDFIIVCTKKFSALEAIACHHQQTSTERTRKTTMFIGKKQIQKQRSVSHNLWFSSYSFHFFIISICAQFSVVMNIIATDRSYSGHYVICSAFIVRCFDEKDTSLTKIDFMVGSLCNKGIVKAKPSKSNQIIFQI